MNKIFNYSDITNDIEDYILYRENSEYNSNKEQKGGSVTSEYKAPYRLLHKLYERINNRNLYYMY